MVVNTNIKEGAKENGKKIPHQTSFHENDFFTLYSLPDNRGEFICHYKF